jgi:hypothetical protein
MLHVLPPSPRLLRRDDPVGRSATRAWGGRLKGQVTGRVAWIDVRFGSKADICGAPAHVRFAPNSDRKSGFPHIVMSALPPKADMCSALAYVCFGPIADMR